MISPILLTLLAFASSVDLQVVEGYKNGEKYELRAAEVQVVSPITNKKITLDEVVAPNFNDLLTDAVKDGHEIVVTYGFRTQREQSKLRKKYARIGKAFMAAKPGHSSHQMGLSVDISGTTKKFKRSDKSEEYRFLKSLGGCDVKRRLVICKTELYYWLEKNADKYQFVNDVPYEPWHWTFLPKEISNEDEEDKNDPNV